MDQYRPTQLMHAADVGKPVLDYWHKTGLLSPSGPDGTFTAREMSLGLVLAKAAHHGAPNSILARIVASLEGPPSTWPDQLYVDADGHVATDDVDTDVAWIIRPRRLLVHAGPQMLLALAS